MKCAFFIKNRQPIGKMFIKASWKLNEFFTDIIADELNVKSVEYKDDVRDFTSYTFKPQLKTLGPKYGKFLGEIRKQLTELDGNKAMDDLNNTGFITLQVNGQDIQLEKADLLIEMTQMEGYVANSDKGITVVMDTNLTPELIEEGFVREIVSKIQTMRKDAGFEVMDGQQIANYDAQNFNSLPIERVYDENGNPLVVDVPYTNYQVHAYVWQMNVGRIKLYLLDTDNDMNSEFDRPITHSLYGGDWENRLKQEILLGIGGMLALKKMGIKKDIYHCNEGHAALCNLQRLCDYIEEDGLNFNQALELVRASSLYTVHTPVPAGHDYFDEALFGKYMGGYPQRLGISWDEFIGMGRENADDHNERFCLSTFACNTCQEVNGVSKLHGWVSQQMFANIWKGYFPEENHVGYVTNGVHFPTWTATEWRKLYDTYFDKNFMNDQSNEEIWHAIYNVSDAEIWNTRMALKKKLVAYIREKFTQTWLKNQGDPARVVSLLERINPNALMIGFCRRFATYKRAHLLFTDLDRLSKIVNDPEHPVLFFFSGKAHPADGAGQGLIKRIFEISQRPEFLGKIIFLEDYDMTLARRLVSGVDIWMNTPTRPLEASGTSGEKAEMNGVVNLSVLDGWWVEGYREGAGWALPEKRTYQNQGYQDQLDAATIYNLLENDIIPMYYNKNKEGFSKEWIQVVKNSIATIAPHYTMKRQLDDYYDKFYNKQAARFKKLSANDNALAKEIALWKESVAERWDGIKSIFSGIWNAIKGIFEGIWNAIKDFVTGILDTIKNLFSNIWNGIKEAVSGILNGIKEDISFKINLIKAVLSNILNSIKDTWGKIWNGLKDSVGNIWNAINMKRKCYLHFLMF